MRLKIPRVVKNWEFAALIEPCKDIDAFIDNGNGRRFARADEAAYWAEAFSAFGLKPICVEPKFQNMTTNHFLDSACTHEHQDLAPDGFAHVRCNVMLKKPPRGGNPIIDGECISVDVNDLWLCLASLEKHASEPIQGGQRLMFSFGGLVPLEQINRIVV